MAEPLKDILSKALQDTLHFLGWNKRTYIAAFLFILGTLITFLLYGEKETMNELERWFFSVLIPICSLAFLIFLWNLIVAPYRLSKAREIKSIDKTNKLQQELDKLKPIEKIKIDYKENEPNYYEESFSWPPDVVKDMSSSELFKTGHDLHRISIKNLSQSQPIEGVKVEITKIEPVHYRISHNIPIKLRFMGDRKESLDTSININPNEEIFVDVIQWGSYAVYDYNFEILNSENKNVRFNFKEGDEYILTIKASGKNAKVESRRFKISYINEPAKNLKLSFQSID